MRYAIDIELKVEAVRKPIKRALCVCILTVLPLLLVFCPGLPWSRQCRHALKRVVVKVEMKVSAWQGEQPKLVSLSGKIIQERPGNEALKGARIEALDSTSGWASLSDEHGDFVLRDVTWYPRATYTLIIEANDCQARRIQVSAPAVYPEGRLVKLGELDFDRGCKIDTDDLSGKNSISYVEYDKKNIEFYRQLFAELTQGKRTDEENIEAINRYIARKLDLSGSDEHEESPRQVIEKGTAYCGKLALAMATLAEAGHYKTRLLDLIDEAPHPAAHMVTEVYYGDRWHLYDPTAGVDFRNKGAGVASYKGLRLDQKFVCSALPDHLPVITDARDNWAVGIYRSGLHHYYYLRGTW